MSVIASTQSSVLSSTNLSLDLPANDASLDLFAAVVFYKTVAGTPMVTAPSGWTLIDTQAVSAVECQVALFWKVGDGTTSVNFAFSAACHATAGCVSLPGRASSPFESAAVAFRSVTQSFSSNSLNTTVANETLIYIAAGFPLTPPFEPSSLLSSENGVNIGGNQPGPNGSLPPLVIAQDFQAVTGATGTRTATTSFNGSGTVFLIGWKADNRPTVPAVVYAAGGENLTTGATVALRCTAATSPTVAASVLQYEFSYSLNNGGTWSVIGLSPAGVISKTWTVPATLGNTNLIRVRAYDGSLYSPVYGYGLAFNIIAETAPNASITSPSTGAIVAKSASTPIAWSYSGGPGNPQTQFTLQWATNSSFTSPNTVGPSSTATQLTTIDTSALTDGQTVYVRVKARGATLYSAYSSAVAFIVASAPATPNITAPTNASPPTSATHTVTFTESSTFVARRFRVVQASIEVYNAVTTSSALSFPSPFPFANGVVVTIYLSVQNIYGLWSAEDSETVTPAYTGPTKPTLAASANDASGYVALKITNSGSRTADYIYRRQNGQAKSEAIRITPALGANAQYEDHAAGSDVDYVYFDRCFNGATYTDSDDSSPVSVTLDRFHVFAVSRDSLTSNVLGSPVKLLNLADTGGHEYVNAPENIVDLLGRSEPGAIFGEAAQESLTLSAFISFADEAAYLALLAAFDAVKGNGTLLCIRDNLANRVFARPTDGLSNTIDVDGYRVAATFIQTDYSEAIQ